MTGKIILRRGTQVLVAYVALWLLTLSLGRYQVRAPILAAVRDTVLKARPALASIELHSSTLLPQTAKQYYVLAAAPCPFLVRIDRGYQIEPLWGSGAREWYLWFFGIRVRVARPMMWFS